MSRGFLIATIEHLQIYHIDLVTLTLNMYHKLFVIRETGQLLVVYPPILGFLELFVL